MNIYTRMHIYIIYIYIYIIYAIWCAAPPPTPVGWSWSPPAPPCGPVGQPCGPLLCTASVSQPATHHRYPNTCLPFHISNQQKQLLLVCTFTYDQRLTKNTQHTNI